MSKQFFQLRPRFEIYSDLLRESKTFICKYKLLEMTGNNYERIDALLKPLIDSKLMEQKNKQYRSTVRGRQFVRAMDKLSYILKEAK